MRAPAVAFALAMAFLSQAEAQSQTPFAAPAAPDGAVVKLLAPAQSFEPGLFAAFEAQNNVTVLVDAAEPTAGGKLRLAGYDLALLGPGDLLKAAAQGEIKALDKARFPNARNLSPEIAKKFAAYGAAAGLAFPYDWDVLGIGYDQDKVVQRLGGPPNWQSLFQPDLQRSLLDCGLALPDDRDALFFGAWKALGVDPPKAQEINVAPAAYLVTRARKIVRVFGAADSGGVYATGGACIGIATASNVAATQARAGKAGGLDFRFLAPKDGAAITFHAFAIPKEARSELVYALLDFLSRAEVAKRNALYSGAASTLDGSASGAVANLEPLGAIDPKVLAAVDAAWASARVTDPPQLPPVRPRGPTR